RNESVCDVGWLLTVCPMTHMGLVLLSLHISILPPHPLCSYFSLIVHLFGLYLPQW
ncbi:hypothetical protein KUCAC02_025538, partial [Chaenocephalus aceratus]